MKKKTKVRITIISISIFLVLAPLAVLYSKGYRLDNWKMVKTGGLFFNVEPSPASIDLGNREKRTGIFGSILIEGLLPKKHNVTISKKGYLPWNKTLGVKEEQVTSAKSVRLVPEEIQFKQVSTNIDRFWTSSKYITLQRGQSFQQLDLRSGVKSAWSAPIVPKGYSIVGMGEYIFLEKDKTIFILYENQLTRLTQETIAYQSFDESIIYLRTDGHLVESTLDNNKVLTENPLNTDGIKQFRFSPSGKKLVLATDHELRILFLEKQEIQPIRDKDEEMFLTRLSDKINDVYWWDDFHLIIASENNNYGQVSIIELDNRDRAQSWNITQASSPKIFFNEKDRRLYLLSENNLLVSEGI